MTPPPCIFGLVRGTFFPSLISSGFFEKFLEKLWIRVGPPPPSPKIQSQAAFFTLWLPLPYIVQWTLLNTSLYHTARHCIALQCYMHTALQCTLLLHHTLLDGVRQHVLGKDWRAGGLGRAWLARQCNCIVNTPPCRGGPTLSRMADWIQGYMYTLGRRGLRVSNSPVSS